MYTCGNEEARVERGQRLGEIVNCCEAKLSAMLGVEAPPPRDLSASRHNKRIMDAVGIARRHQAVLSWEGFLQGRHSMEWVRVQRLHETLRRERPRKGSLWEHKSVNLVCALVPSLWKKRNDIVHGATMVEAARRRRERVTAMVCRLYRRNPTLLPRFPSVWAVKLEERLQRPVEVLHVWLKPLERQERITEAMRTRQATKAGSIRWFLVPRRCSVVGQPVVPVVPVVFDRGRG